MLKTIGARIQKQAGLPLEASEQRTWIRRLCSWTMNPEELTTNCESLFNVKKENETEARAAVDFLQNSWTAGKSESESEAREISTGFFPSANRSTCIFERKKQEASSRRRSHESGSGSPPERSRSTTSGQVQTNRVPGDIEEMCGVSLPNDFVKDQMRSLPQPS